MSYKKYLKLSKLPFLGYCIRYSFDQNQDVSKINIMCPTAGGAVYFDNKDVPSRASAGVEQSVWTPMPMPTPP